MSGSLINAEKRATLETLDIRFSTLLNKIHLLHINCNNDYLYNDTFAFRTEF